MQEAEKEPLEEVTPKSGSVQEAKKCFLVLDKDGPLTASRLDELNREQRVFARDDFPPGPAPLP